MKSSFERVYSQIDRKKLFQTVVDEKTKIHIKAKSGSVVTMTPEEIDSKADIYGTLSTDSVKSGDKVTALFIVNGESYFLKTRIYKKNEIWWLANDPQFFKFNRRTAFRTPVPVGSEIIFKIETIRNIEVNKKCDLMEFSTGGARIHWRSQKPLTEGTILKARLTVGDEKAFDLEASVVHHRGEGVYGIKWQKISALGLQRLKLLSIELQMKQAPKK